MTLWSKERLLPAFGQLNPLCLLSPSSLVPLLPVIGIDNRLTGIFKPNASVDCVCADMTRILRALRTDACIDTVYMSPPWGGPSPPHNRPLLLKFFEICIAGNFGPLWKS
ncbi:RNA cap guanine N2 methyltransferase [Echinococcus multilocularis]|uniref:RNA cap guanine N2 methyltransferase n=1 Tax=Echinococcus multilocularis TaxID=6211 RepID=A0A068XWA6_ECHMU|nr:RNA cap guanine N2 methyltransferase [Echinococcus multilocularis]